MQVLGVLLLLLVHTVRASVRYPDYARAQYSAQHVAECVRNWTVSELVPMLDLRQQYIWFDGEDNREVCSPIPELDSVCRYALEQAIVSQRLWDLVHLQFSVGEYCRAGKIEAFREQLHALALELGDGVEQFRFATGAKNGQFGGGFGWGFQVLCKEEIVISAGGGGGSGIYPVQFGGGAGIQLFRFNVSFGGGGGVNNTMEHFDFDADAFDLVRFAKYLDESVDFVRNCSLVQVRGGGGGGSGIDLTNLIPLHQGLGLESSDFRMGYGFSFSFKLFHGKLAKVE